MYSAGKLNKTMQARVVNLDLVAIHDDAGCEDQETVSSFDHSLAQS